MWSNIRTEDGHSTHNLAFCHDVYMTHTSGVKTNTNVQYATVVSPPEQIYAYVENPQLRNRAVGLLYTYEMLP